MTIRLVNVSKSYISPTGRHQVFRDLNLDFPRGRNTGVIGANGSGKSTLLNLLAGADQPDSGYVDRDVRMSWPVGFSGAVNPALSGVANARFCARLYDRDPDEVAALTAEFAGLEAVMQWPVKNYSTGMRAKFGFALSMAIDFECLLVDEVLGVADAAFRAKCHAAIEERRARCDMILVSHNLKDVIRLCDRVVVLGGPQPIVSDDVQKTVKTYALAMNNVQEALELDV
jgi:capsular polysaccharide transport system ATP-binding protein